MTTLCFYGASDDTVEFEGAISDEFGCYNTPWSGKLIGPAPLHEQLQLRAHYGPDEWELSVGSVPDVARPDWPIHFGQRPGREDDPAIFIDVPEGTTIEDDDADDE